MGKSISRLRFALQEFLDIIASYESADKRIQQSPGLPVDNPTRSFWMYPPSSVAAHRSSPELPSHADVVILGSGITGASVARALLSDDRGVKLNIVMLEAREACSGATGRNGGHITPPLYADYPALKAKYGHDAARTILHFRWSHIAELGRVAAEDDPENECQYRTTETLDAYYNEDKWAEAKRALQEYQQDLPEEGGKFAVYEHKEAAERFGLADHVVGVIVTQAGAIQPYRFVTHVLARLLDKYKRFRLYTNTPCTEISQPTKSSPYYTVRTPTGDITTPHVVHATNSYASTLLTPMRAKIVPVRGTMSAQRPGASLASKLRLSPGKRSWVFYSDDGSPGYDYLTQLPGGEHELMLGGGFFKGGLREIGNTDDASYNIAIVSHLSGAMPVYFGESRWGAEGEPAGQEAGEWFEGRVKALWSGIIGISADKLPWVGRLSRTISGRKAPPASSTPRDVVGYRASASSAKLVGEEKGEAGVLTAEPGEWLAAGFTGEGMPNAWLSGKALAWLLLGKTPGWLPDALVVTEKRWRKADIAQIL